MIFLLGEVGSRPSGSQERSRAESILGRGLLTGERFVALQAFDRLGHIRP